MGAVLLVLDLPEPSPSALGALRAWLELLGAHGLRATAMLGAGEAANWRQQLGPEGHARLCQQALGLRWSPTSWPTAGFDHYGRLRDWRRQQWRQVSEELAAACGVGPAAVTMTGPHWCPVGLSVVGQEATTVALDAPLEERQAHHPVEVAGVALIRGHLRVNELALAEDATGTFGRLQEILEASATPGSLLTVHADLGAPGAEQVAFNRKLLGCLLNGREAHRWTCANELPPPRAALSPLSPAAVIALASRLGERLEPLAMDGQQLTVAQQFSVMHHPVYPRRLAGPPAPEMTYAASVLERDTLLAAAADLRLECQRLGDHVPSAVRVGENWLPPSAWLRAAARVVSGVNDPQSVAARPLPLLHATRREWRELAERSSAAAPLAWRSWIHEWWLAQAWTARPVVDLQLAAGGT
jgi:hypothetical protein